MVVACDQDLISASVLILRHLHNDSIDNEEILILKSAALRNLSLDILLSIHLKEAYSILRPLVKATKEDYFIGISQLKRSHIKGLLWEFNLENSPVVLALA